MKISELMLVAVLSIIIDIILQKTLFFYFKVLAENTVFYISNMDNFVVSHLISQPFGDFSINTDNKMWQPQLITC